MDKTYDGSTVATLDGAVAISGVVGAEVVGIDANAATGSFADKNAGKNKAVQVSGLALSGADAGNYAIASPELFASIGQKTVAVSGLMAVDKTYDGTANAALQGSASVSGVVGSDHVGVEASAATGAFADKNAGQNKAVLVSGLALSGADAGNYAIVETQLSASIAPKQLSVSGIIALDKVYDGAVDASLDASGVRVEGAISGDQVSWMGPLAGAFLDASVGADKVVATAGGSLTGADSSNYAFSAPELRASILASQPTGPTTPTNPTDPTGPATPTAPRARSAPPCPIPSFARARSTSTPNWLSTIKS